MQDLLFVYGTLMRGFDHPMARLLEHNADFLGEAQCPGRLYLVRHYPGLVDSDDDNERVHGHLFRLRQPAQLLAELDDYEGCGADAPPPAEYRRELRTITAADGTAQQAWVYLYNWPIDGMPLIAGGRFDLA
ncbi:gamma-glutamylcyclotransferase (GGCT)/AIG2-like uncharacterized protein YtfP [Rhodopseudomonas faecalis]|uniref:Gamma-glutamylcyclotransferase (GGCT)/AIG2-like uncharacterized protein YtfP n=1 Tax=Rhodopseudomonas faecalis TaxID=99655 RepID=A0A318THM8_9BRAD|nr:gamma-glutamylcyclotransferase family protein [Rhodopseudomonas faecalis]PYF04351.1 gamma-glutamylcyclotransferase (GGCT)/AIG2-like uncharacterized protein YtfP [Rhodopseudomonas faecalis]TAH64709.1 MAG: gamma-glutamylcyclotransferase [Rhodopseudomonas palustris]